MAGSSPETRAPQNLHPSRATTVLPVAATLVTKLSWAVADLRARDCVLRVCEPGVPLRNPEGFPIGLVTAQFMDERWKDPSQVPDELYRVVHLANNIQSDLLDDTGVTEDVQGRRLASTGWQRPITNEEMSDGGA